MESLKHKGSLHSGAFSHFLSPIPAWASLPVPRALPHPRDTPAGLCTHPSLPRSPLRCESCGPMIWGPALPSLKVIHPCSALGLAPPHPALRTATSASSTSTSCGHT